MATHYKVTLTFDERRTLDGIVSKGKHSAAKIKHANILLAVDESDGRVKQSDADIAKQFHCHYNNITIHRVLKKMNYSLTRKNVG
ncbi:hypothetical protein FACS1894189_5750 [Planctomycetales bacterium]|nr:hypothetical protein FACS1894189_5750 [Planctomycetales bacterium]